MSALAFSIVGCRPAVPAAASAFLYSWDAEARYRMPASVWHETMAAFFPGGAWVRIERETMEALQAFRGRQAYTSWDAAIRARLARGVAREPV